MNIAYISSSVAPSLTANSVHVFKMCAALARGNHRVTLFLRQYPEMMCPGVDDVYSYYGVMKGFALDETALPKMMGRHLWYGLVVTIKYFLRKGDFDIIYSRDLVSALLLLFLGEPLILEAHDMRAFEKFPRIFRYVFKKKSLVRFVVITNSLRSSIIQLFPEIKEKVVVAPDGADEFGEIHKNSEIDYSLFNVGYVGSLYPGKGAEVVMKLAALCHWAQFHVVGGRDDEVMKMKRETNSLDNISWYGHRSHNEIPLFINSFDVVLLPNQKKVGTAAGDRDIGKWTSPLKMFEYMAAGKPIIASDLEVLKEVLRHGNNCLLCPPEDIESWCSALHRLRDNSNLKNYISANALSDFVKNYTWSKRAERIFDFS